MKYRFPKSNRREYKYIEMDLNDSEDVETIASRHRESEDVDVELLMEVEDMLNIGYGVSNYMVNLTIPVPTYRPNISSCLRNPRSINN